jgi:hypothetical protein
MADNTDTGTIKWMALPACLYSLYEPYAIVYDLDCLAFSENIILDKFFIKISKI